MPRARQHAAVVRLGPPILLAMMLLMVALPAAVLSGVTRADAAVIRTAEETPSTPLTVTITSLTPSAIPASGPIVVQGTVTNIDAVAWQDVTLYPFIGFSPITTETELDAAMETAEAAEVGQRIQTEGDYTNVGELTAGETVSFSLRIPRRHLRDLGVNAPGVYWFGVHALGSGPDGRDKIADGRARTFLPLLSSQASSVSVTAIVPVRAAVIYAADGSIDDTDRWLALLRSGGRLARLADLLDSPGGHDVSWLVDPAVLAAVKHLAEGNAPRPVGVDPEPNAGPSGSPSPSATSSGSGQAADSTGSAGSAESSGSAETAELTTLAERWWTRMHVALQGADVLALPYGDVDLSAAAEHNRSLYRTARTLSTALFEDWGIPSSPVNAPVQGQLDRATIEMLAERDPGTTVLVTDALLPEGTTTDQVSAASLRLVAFDSSTSAGGPAPTDALSGTALRQRVLAEAAVHALSGASARPVIVELPIRWSTADASELARGLRQPWLSLHSLNTTLAGTTSTTVDPEELLIRDHSAARTISQRTISSAAELIHTGRTLQRVLTQNTRVSGATTAEALTSVSYQRRTSTSPSNVTSTLNLDALLGQITVTAPRSVTLSGSSGRFATTISNGLDQPVTVALKPVTDAGISISTPKSIVVAPGTSATVVLEADHARVGVHDVRLLLTDTSGTRFALPVSVPVRAAQVSKIIWVFIAVGCGLLFGAICSRLFRRIRSAKKQESTDV